MTELPNSQLKLPLCQSCGAQLDGGEKFCDVCGAPMRAAPVQQPEAQVPQQPTHATQGLPKSHKLRNVAIAILVFFFILLLIGVS